MSNLGPIAIIDTGVGGLSVALALKKLAPHEEILYFADTKNLPYGYKSHELIKKLAKDFIKSSREISKCKMLIIACHTISVLALPKDEDLETVVIDMLKPSILGIKDIIRSHNIKKLSMISTKSTYDSGVYKKAFAEYDVDFKQNPLGYLVHLVEDAELSTEKIAYILDNTLTDDFKNADALILGCTHFSALTDSFKSIMKKDCLIIDPADFVAQNALSTLRTKGLLCETNSNKSFKIFVTDNPERFSSAASRFIQNESLDISLMPNF